MLIVALPVVAVAVTIVALRLLQHAAVLRVELADLVLLRRRVGAVWLLIGSLRLARHQYGRIVDGRAIWKTGRHVWSVPSWSTVYPARCTVDSGLNLFSICNG